MLTTQCGLATLLDPQGGRTTHGVGLGALMTRLLLLHALPDRARWRLRALRFDTRQQAAIQHCLGGHPQVISFRLNVDCHSLVVSHRGTAKAIEALIEQAIDRALRVDDRPPASSPGAACRPVQGNGVRQAFAWASAALILSPVRAMAPLTMLPLIVAGVPIWRRGATTLVRERRLNVDFLDGLALAVALLRRQTTTGALMAWMVHLGDVIRDHTARSSQRQITALMDFQAVQARRVDEDGTVRVVPARDLQEALTVLVLAGDLVPADGVVASGTAWVDQRSITGESMPATRRAGDLVYAGSTTVDGSLKVTVTAAGSETVAARIVQLLEAAPIGETRIQNYAEKFADRLVAPLLGSSVALLAWTGNMDRFLSMAMIDYGTGIRVAAPTGVLASMVRAARHGILIKGGHHVEQLACMEAIAFDKTGTLTRGAPAILDVRMFSAQVPAEHLVRLAAAAETQLRHPVAQAMVRYAVEQKGLVLPACDDVDFSIGLGVTARIGAEEVRVGNERYFRAAGIGMARAAGYLRDAERHGHSALLVAIDGTLAGAVAYADELRPEAAAVIAGLRRRKVHDIVMLTGDRAGVAARVAATLGIRQFHAEVMPAEKADVIRALRKAAGPIAMVGDGVNDSVALAQADIGIALVEGADIAREAADVVLMEGDLGHIIDAIDISRDAIGLVRQNYALIAAFNTLALGLALPPGGAPPAVTTLLSNGSALLALLNAMRPLLDVPGRREAAGLRWR